MGLRGIAGSGVRGRAVPVLVVVAAAVLASGAGAAASPRPGAGPAPRSAVAAGTISTVAGGVGGPAKATTVALPGDCGVAFGAGHLYVGDSGSVREVTPGTGLLTTPAGIGLTSVLSPLGDRGPAAKARLAGACGVALDHSANLVIADTYDNRVRVVAAGTGAVYGRAMTAGDIYTLTGNGVRGFSGDGGPAAKAVVNRPGGVAVDAAGNVVIADSGNNRLRVVAARTGTFYGQAMTAGDIYTVAGTQTGGYSGDGGPATSARLHTPQGVAVDAAGNLVIADTGNNRIRVVAVSTGTSYGRAMTAGDIYTIAGDGKIGFSGDGGPAIHAEIGNPGGVAVDAAGNVLIADSFNSRVRVVAARGGSFYGRAMSAGDIYTIAGDGTPGFFGDGGPATGAELSGPSGVVVDGAGNVVIADSGNNRARVVAVSTGTFYGRAMTAGDIYTMAGNGDQDSSGDSGSATSAELVPVNVAVDGAGNVLTTDSGSEEVRVTAARTGTFYGRAMTAGDIYTIAGNDRTRLSQPDGVAVDAAGNLLIADSGSEQMIRVVADRTGTFYGQAMTAGDIYTIAGDGTPGFSGDGGPARGAELSGPSGVVVDGAGNVLIADQNNSRIRVVAARGGNFYGRAMTAGDIYTIAGDGTPGFSGDGGPATGAELDGPSSVVVDGAGNVLIADQNNSRIRVVAARTGTFYGQAMTAGHIYTVAGGGTTGLGDGGPATSAELNFPAGVAVDAAGNVLIADTNDYRARVVAARTGTFYGQAMTAGDIYTVAGSRSRGAFSGDGGPGTSAELNSPLGVAADAAGNLLIADFYNHRVREVAG